MRLRSDTTIRSGLTRAELKQSIDRNHIIFQELAERAKQSFLRGDYESSAGYVQVAAHYAWFNPTGLFASPELESIIKSIGETALPAFECMPAPNLNGETSRVLHVLSEVYEVGGHTRFVARWIEADAKRRHSVVITRHGDAEMPRLLVNAVESSGGRIQLLDRQSGGVLRRARVLRGWAAKADHVVLHTHPWDVLPLIALARKDERPPVTLMNLNDHVFWLGASIADQVAQLRDSGSRLSVQRRGIPEARCPLLPIPLTMKPRTLQRAEAKRALGLPEDTVLLLSVASGYKFTRCGNEHFVDVLLPIVQKYARVVLLVVGPDSTDQWASASEQTQGRFKALGKRSDLDLYHQASDIYLDSFPFNSLTSTLESCSYGTPLVAYCIPSLDAEVFSSDDPALKQVVNPASSKDDYLNRLSGAHRKRGSSRRDRR